VAKFNGRLVPGVYAVVRKKRRGEGNCLTRPCHRKRKPGIKLKVEEQGEQNGGKENADRKGKRFRETRTEGTPIQKKLSYTWEMNQKGEVSLATKEKVKSLSRSPRPRGDRGTILALGRNGFLLRS